MTTDDKSRAIFLSLWYRVQAQFGLLSLEQLCAKNLTVSAPNRPAGLHFSASYFLTTPHTHTGGVTMSPSWRTPGGLHPQSHLGNPRSINRRPLWLCFEKSGRQPFLTTWLPSSGSESLSSQVWVSAVALRQASLPLLFPSIQQPEPPTQAGGLFFFMVNIPPWFPHLQGKSQSPHRGNKRPPHPPLPVGPSCLLAVTLVLWLSPEWKGSNLRSYSSTRYPFGSSLASWIHPAPCSLPASQPSLPGSTPMALCPV